MFIWVGIFCIVLWERLSYVRCDSLLMFLGIKVILFCVKLIFCMLGFFIVVVGIFVILLLDKLILVVILYSFFLMDWIMFEDMFMYDIEVFLMFFGSVWILLLEV